MFRFREFRGHCRNGETAEIIESMEKCLEFEDRDSYFRACSYLSELINSNELKANEELINCLNQTKYVPEFHFNLKEKSTRIAIFIKHSKNFPIELLSCINRIYFTPVVVLIGNTPDNTEFSQKLDALSFANRIIEQQTNLDDQLKALQSFIKEEKIGRLIVHANPADLDFKVLTKSCSENIICYHPETVLETEFSYSETAESLNLGSWKTNKAFPLFNNYSTIILKDGDELTEDVFQNLKSDRLLLLNDNPLECLKNLDEAYLEKVVFISDPKEYSNGLKSTAELLVKENNFKESLDLAFEYGLPIRNIDRNEESTYSELIKEFGLKNRFTNVLNHLYETKSSFRKKLPRIVFFRNDGSAPIIEALNKNISAALKHSDCPVLDIDIGPMVKASKEKNWQGLKEIQQKTMDQIDHFGPDQALGYNDVGIFPNGDSHVLEKRNIPYNGLFFDNPFYFMHNLKHCKNKEMVRLFTLDENFVAPLKEGGFINTHYFPIATSMHHNTLANTQNFDPDRFIFTATIKKFRDAEEVSVELENKNDREFLIHAFKEILENDCFSVNEILAKYKHFYSKDFIRFQNDVWFRVDNQCSSQLRVQTVEAMKDFPLDIYGGSNWNEIELSPNHQFKGRMNYLHLSEAARTSKGTICRTPINIQNGIQQRILDCGAARGLIITDYRPILEHHFELDKELFTFRNGEELKDKLHFLSNNPKAVEKSKKLLHKKVMEQHTWDIRIQELINFLV